MRWIVDHLQAVRLEIGRTVDDFAARSVHTDVDGVDNRDALFIVNGLATHLVHFAQFRRDGVVKELQAVLLLVRRFDLCIAQPQFERQFS